MGGIKIVDGSLVISVTDEKQVSALAKLDANRDGKVEVNERGRGVESKTIFRERVTQALAGGGAFKSTLQQRSFRAFLDIYPKIQQFNKVTDAWSQNRTNTTTQELSFNKDYWDSEVFPKITGKGDLTPEKISQLSIDLYTTMSGLADSEIPESSDLLPSPFMDCYTDFISYIVYSTYHVPPMIREQLTEAIDLYSNSAAWLGQYKEIECDGNGLFDGCGVFEEVNIQSAKILPPHRTCASKYASFDNLNCASMDVVSDRPWIKAARSVVKCYQGPIGL